VRTTRTSSCGSRQLPSSPTVSLKLKRTLPLTGELVARRRGVISVARFTPGFVAQFGHLRSTAVRGDRRAAQVVTQQEMQRATALAHCDPLTVRVVILHHRGRAASSLEVVAHVVGGHAAHYGFDAVADLSVGQVPP
jgi:hypothetical protein